MRLIFTALAALLAVPAAAQPGHGTIEGRVYPFDAEVGYGASRWTDAEGERLADGAVSEGSPTVTLIPILAHLDPEVREVQATGPSGAFAFEWVPIGSYRLRVTAPGYQPWEAEVYLAFAIDISVLLRPLEE